MTHTFKTLYPPKTGPDTLIITFDVTNLYSNILHELGKQGISFWNRKHYTEDLTRNLSLIL